MSKYKTFICFCIIFCTLLCLFSCAKRQSNIDEIFSQLVLSDSAEPDGEAFTEHIYVVIPDGCSGELSLKARELVDKIKEKTDILTSLKYDSELTSAPKNSCEILIGNTNRLASENAMDVLRKDEYLWRWDNGAIVICGRSDDSTVLAIDAFMAEILPSASEYSLMHSEAHFEFTCEYDIRNIVLGGYDLYDYVLTYPKENKNGEKDVAFKLRDIINAKSGYFLEVISDSDITAKTGRTINVSASGEENALIPNDNGFSLVGKDIYSLSLVIAKFIGDISNNANDGKVDLKYSNRVDIEAPSSLLESVFCYIKQDESNPIGVISDLVKMWKNGSTGICFVGNPNEILYEDLKLNVADPLKMIDTAVGERNIIIVYDSEKIKTLNVEVGSDGNCLIANAETVLGEKICFIYIISGEAPKNDSNNLVIFYENTDKTEHEGYVTAVSGKEDLSFEKLSYLLACDENLNIKNPDEIVSNGTNLFTIVLKTEVIYSDAFLNNPLK